MRQNDARKLPKDVLEHIRQQALSLRQQGYTWEHIAEVCGVLGLHASASGQEGH